MSAMRTSPLALIACVSCLSCAGEPPARVSRAAVPIKSACTAGSRPASSAGLDVRNGRRHSESQTIFVTNLSDEARTVRVQQVSRVQGACSAEWAGQTPLNFVDARTGARPDEQTVPPGASIQVQVGAQRVNGTRGCTKLALALWMKVDGELVCADAGAWIGTDDETD
jgi:hypothetical protein